MLLFDMVVAVPKADTPAKPFTPTTPPASIAAPPLVTVADKPLGDTVAFATTDIVPRAEVPAPGADSVTGMGWPQVN